MCGSVFRHNSFFTFLDRLILIVFLKCVIICKMKSVEYKRILIVEDDAALRNSLCDHFSVRNSVTAAGGLSQAVEAVHDCKFDIIILDVILPDGSGLKLFDYIENTPVIILSDLGSDGCLLDGFAAGAADYIVKPASPEIIEARMSLRMLPDTEAEICLHGLNLNINRRTAVYSGTPLDLTSSEFNILMFLMQNAGAFFTANDIYEKVWKMPHLNTSTIKVHLSNLRKKMFGISKDCADLIITNFGKGYAFRGGGNE